MTYSAPVIEAARGEARKAGEGRPFDDYMPQRKAGVWTGASQRRFISSSSIDTVTEQPGHIERCDEISDQRSPNDNTGWFEQSADRIVHQIKLRERRCPEAVDQQDGLAARALAQIGNDGVDHLRRDFGSRPEFYPRLAMNTHADLHLVLGDV